RDGGEQSFLPLRIQYNERFVVLAFFREGCFVYRQIAGRSSLFNAHPMERVDAASRCLRGLVERGSQGRVRRTPFTYVVAVPSRGAMDRKREVALGNESGASIFHNERMCVGELSAQPLHFSPRLAGDKHPRNLLAPQLIERRTRGLPGIRVVVEQRSVQVGKDDVPHALLGT